MQYRFRPERRGRREGNASAQRTDVTKRYGIESHGKRLIEDSQKIRVVVDLVVERAVRSENLDEERLPAILSVRAIAKIADLRFEAPRFAVGANR
jgi:hypothetical protein